jgi:hypothetical protein
MPREARCSCRPRRGALASPVRPRGSTFRSAHPRGRHRALGRVVFQSRSDRQPFRQQNLRSNAVHVPGVPALCQALLHLPVLRGFRRQRLARCEARRHHTRLGRRAAGKSKCKQPHCSRAVSGFPQAGHLIQSILLPCCSRCGSYRLSTSDNCGGTLPSSPLWPAVESSESPPAFLCPVVSTRRDRCASDAATDRPSAGL